MRDISNDKKVKENIVYDPLFMKKMQKIHTKTSSCSSIGISQLTHLNLFNNRINVDTSKHYKKNNNSIEERHISSQLDKSSSIIQDKNSSFISLSKKHNIRSANVSKSKSKEKSNQLYAKNNNTHLYVKYGGNANIKNISQNINTKSSNIFPYDNISSNIKFDIRKMPKTAYPSKNNSRKNSAEKKHIYSLVKSLEMGNKNKNCNYNVNVNINVNNINNNINNVFHYKNNSELNHKNGVSYINNLIKSTHFVHGYKNNVKYIEYITSGLKNNSSTKNTSLSNKSSKRKDEIERDYLQTKIQLKYNKNLTTVHSKNNSKSTSRVEEYINTKQSDYKKPIKHNVPLTACQSPNSIEKVYECPKAYLKKNFDIFNNINQSNEINVIDTENDIEKLLNNTIDSVQSTAREAMYYRKELEKLSNYIKQYHFIHGSYPNTKIQFYKYGRVIGRGAFGKVNIALHICSGRLVAIKSFNKKKLKSKHAITKIYHEIEILKKLRHPFISQIYDTFETDTHILIVMEYICGDLLSFIRKRAKLNESSAKIIFKQVTEGLKYIHSNKIVHRDIKLDNILIDLNNTVKICDFGVSRKLSTGDIMHENCGTPAYIAPEIFQNKGYEGYACDIWSAGVTLYYMLAGVQPFKAKNFTELKKIIKIGKYQKIDSLSLEAQDLIDGMLQTDPRKRLTLNQILNHPWLSDVDVNNRYDMHLFTNAEKVLLSKYDVDYLNSPKEDLIENFTMKNLDTINEEKKNNGNTKSFILAPYNSYDINKSHYIDKELKIENDLIHFGGKVKQANIKYELYNNQDFDNGMIITQKESDDKTNSLSNPISPNVEVNDKRRSGMNSPRGSRSSSKNHSVEKYMSITVKDDLIAEIENVVGYDKKYLKSCIKKNEINYATATYYLLAKNIYE